jgi:hypothetical protein
MGSMREFTVSPVPGPAMLKQTTVATPAIAEIFTLVIPTVPTFISKPA